MVRGANTAKTYVNFKVLHCENIAFSEAQILHREGMGDIGPSIAGAQGSPSRTISKNNKPRTADCGPGSDTPWAFGLANYTNM